jgi:hypothetical protein
MALTTIGVTVPPPTVPLTNPVTGQTDQSWQEWFQAAHSALDAIASLTLPVQQNVDVIEEFVGSFAFPSDGSPFDTIILDQKYGYTIDEITVKTALGTTTATWKINGVALGGGANSATTTKSTVTHNSANVMVAHDTLTVDLSSTSADCTGLSWTIKGRRQIPMLVYA